MGFASFTKEPETPKGGLSPKGASGTRGQWGLSLRKPELLHSGNEFLTGAYLVLSGSKLESGT